MCFLLRFYFSAGQHPFTQIPGRRRRAADYINDDTNFHNWGEMALDHEFPWMVLIQDGCNWESKKSFRICGGSLISPSLVLSASHCIKCHINGRNDVAYALFGVHRWSLKLTEYRTMMQKMRDYFFGEPENDVVPIIHKLSVQFFGLKGT